MSEQEATPEKASKPIPEPEVGRLALRVDIMVNDAGDVAVKIGTANPMANAYFHQRYPLAAAMLMGLTRKPEPIAMPAGLPFQDPPSDDGAAPPPEPG